MAFYDDNPDTLAELVEVFGKAWAVEEARQQNDEVGGFPGDKRRAGLKAVFDRVEADGYVLVPKGAGEDPFTEVDPEDFKPGERVVVVDRNGKDAGLDARTVVNVGPDWLTLDVLGVESVKLFKGNYRKVQFQEHRRYSDTGPAELRVTDRSPESVRDQHTN